MGSSDSRHGHDADQTAHAISKILSRFTKYHPERIELSLDRVCRLLAELDNPQEKLPPVIHIAGTNGKGSTIAFLDSVLTASGLRVSTYTSPHLVRFAERYRLAGDIIDERELLTLFEELDTANAGKPITQFEITTAAAFLAMSRTPADVILLETGLGGRFDATNVISRPLATIITPVGFDHMTFLGSRLPEIAGEKAAIQKSGVPSIVAQQAPDAAAVIADAAAAVGAPLHRRGIEWQLTFANTGGGSYVRGNVRWTLPKPALPGRHQLENAALAAACLDICGLPSVNTETLAEGITQANWPGRMQRLTNGVLAETLGPGVDLWLDSAHNPMAAGALAKELDEIQRRDRRPVHLILAMLEDKDVGGFITPLTRHITTVTTVPLAEEAGARSASDLAFILANLGQPARSASSIQDALLHISHNNGRVRVLITGSHLLVGAALRTNS
ncbi:MAG: bifunctional folylpolyglutamate synthase/dihydrofolate synthase [Alphaproteobacteria bacterium]|nr:bifunctional folylpolyglutamate synthase/dihydrofolate synthase [Alphaproteobacteria bacterium]